jgi:hypothetical protein
VSHGAPRCRRSLRSWLRPHIAVIVGSNRGASINRKLAQALVKLGADKFDATFLRIDDLPMFNQDLEANLPAEVVRFKAGLTNADGILRCFSRCRASALGGNPASARMLIFQDNAIAACSF